MKKKIKSDFKIKDFYKYFKNTMDSKMSLHTYSKILQLFTKKLLVRIYEGYVFDIPFGLGQLYLFEYDRKLRFKENGELDVTSSRVSINYKETNQLWRDKPELRHKKYIYYENDHTNGKIFKFYWSKKFTKIPNLSLYAFKPSRTASRQLAQYLKNNNYDS